MAEESFRQHVMVGASINFDKLWIFAWKSELSNVVQMLRNHIAEAHIVSKLV